ncbi:MAG: GNAT family N-acetyltransferase [Lewinellaceae bacterium]|nr:GNAT family N-acetyltransferase [Lewinellaceae bacterium]
MTEKQYPAFELRKIDERYKEQVQDLFKACPEYFWIAEGQEATDLSLKEFFEERPPGTEPQEKHLYGVFVADRLVGVVDLVENYPEPGEWIIGLLLLHPDLRGRGLGGQVHEELVEMARNGGATKMRLGVVTQNERGIAFWTRLGYREISRTAPRLMGKKTSVILVMNRPV